MAHALDSHVRLTWGHSTSQTINNMLNVTFDQKAADLKYSLYTPHYKNEETAILKLKYDSTPESHSNLNADLFFPSAKKVGNARISYASLSNVNGTLNASTHMPQFPYGGCNFIVLTTL